MSVTAGRLIVFGVLALAVPRIIQAQPATTRVSLSSGGTQSNSVSLGPSISANGRWVAFESAASNLVGGDTNNAFDIFVRDRLTSSTSRVSVGPAGVQANSTDGSWSPSISGDGRWVAFGSWASNLVVGDTNGVPDVFVHDRTTGTTTRVSIATGGAQGNSRSDSPTITPDGRWIVFTSQASTLVANDTNGANDIFVHDRQTGTTSRVSEGTGGVQSDNHSGFPAISADGRWVVFQSFASNLAAVDTNSSDDVFLHDRQSGTTTRLSEGPEGVQGDNDSFFPVISADGRWLAFLSAASTLVAGDTNNRVDAFLHDRLSATTQRVSVGVGGAEGNDHTMTLTISADGRWVAFESFATNIVLNDTNAVPDVFVYDRWTATTERVSVGPGGLQGNGSTYFPVYRPSMSAYGRHVAFQSTASNMVADDTNASADVFVRDRNTTSASSPFVHLDADLNADVFTYDPITGNWSSHLSDATGGFVAPGAGSWAPGWAVLPATFNGDALTDFFLFNVTTGEWARMLNDGESGFITEASGSWWPGWERYVMDLDGDGISDFFLHDPATGVWFRCVSTPTGFTYTQGGWNPGWEVYPVQLNGDALGDLFLINRSTGRWFWVLGDPGGGFAYPVTETWFSGWLLYPGDYIGDGLTDFLLHDPPTGTYFVALTTVLGFTYVQGGWSIGWSPLPMDFNADGTDDLFLHDPATGVWFQMVSDGIGNFTNTGGQTWSLGWVLHPSDLNGDFRGDLVLYDPTTGVWYQARNLSPGTFTYSSGAWAAGLTVITRAPMQ